jgi:hypothetical protein
MNPFTKPSGWKDLYFHQKIKIYGKNLTSFHSQYVDKLNAKKIVKDILGCKIEVPKVIKILKNIDDIYQTDINSNHILKSGHGSGWNCDMTKVNDLFNLKNKLKLWNKLYNPDNEYQYKYLKPSFFIEEKINDKILGKTGDAIAYRFRCIYGEIVAIGVEYGIITDHYDINWNLISPRKININIPKPDNLPELLDISRILSKPFEFVRLDYYLSIDNKIYFSEYTFTPNAGKPIFNDELEKTLSINWM